jgi:4-hydroxybenzoate polyprenyltransferase
MEAAARSRAITYARFVKVEHTVFSLPMLFAGAWLAAAGYPGTQTILLIILAGFGARVVALALNRIIDRRIDARNPRTAIRELPRGHMNATEAWLVTLVGLAAYLAAAALLSPICLLLTPVPLAIFVLYPTMKRFTFLAHLGVGLGLAVAPLGAWMAVRQTFAGSGPALLLGAFTLFWVAGFDIIYATLDVDFDRAAGLHSMPSRLGIPRALLVSGIFHVAAFASLAALTLWKLRTPLAGLCLAVIGILLFLEHRQGRDVETAFFRINAIIGFAVLVLVLAGGVAAGAPELQ